jgi:Sensors of blue-light using FAD
MMEPTPAGTPAQSRPAEQTFRLMYRSRSRLSDAERRIELGNIFSTARSNNKSQAVTGALLLTEHWFVQTLEGDEPTVRGLFARIETDPRHDDVVLLEAHPVADRVFSRWAMAKVAADGEPDIPLIAGTKGATAAAGHGTTPEQDEVLNVMRAAAQRGSVVP